MGIELNISWRRAHAEDHIYPMVTFGTKGSLAPIISAAICPALVLGRLIPGYDSSLLSGLQFWKTWTSRMEQARQEGAFSAIDCSGMRFVTS